MTSPSRTSAYSGFSGSLFHVFLTQNEVLSGEQKKESISRVMVGWKNPSLVITIWHHSPSLVMSIGNPRDGYFYHTLTLLMDSYILRAPEYGFWIQVS